MDVPHEVPAWFWDVIEAHKPGTASLAGWLRRAAEDEIVAYQLAYELAAEEVADYWDGPVVDGVQYSEDDTEDLCKWVVAQGRAAWAAARSGPEGMADAVRRYTARDAAEAWTPDGAAHAIFHERFHASLHERMTAAWDAEDGA
ncbi:hypothetical protein [Dactylosporangium sp. CA-092794]|uniref:hypothetical protein n=1 Tax=Dactylosporangium sp. CA-092794 TaxID=3239929 RepID=UPI003D91FB53